MDQTVPELEQLDIIERTDKAKVIMPTFVVEGARLRKVLFHPFASCPMPGRKDGEQWSEREDKPHSV